jgi:hypothetical protein
MPCCTGRSSGRIATVNRSSHAAINTPAAALSVASAACSTINCRSSRRRDAPIADRIASSLCRAAPRTSTRLATLAQAMSSTSDTAPNSTYSVVLKSCTR